MSGVEKVWARQEVLDRVRVSERARLAEVRAAGQVPEAVGPEVPEAPARGPVRMFEPKEMFPSGAGGFELKPSGYRGRKGLQCADSFDVMRAKARAAHGRAVTRAKGKGCKDKDLPVYQEPFSSAQVAMGRFYRDLFESHHAAGMKCSSLEGRSGGSAGSGSDFMDAVIRDGQQLDLLRKRIGSGAALVVRRVRPSARGSRVTIMDRRLVDIVCLEGGTLTDVLKAHGWANDAKAARALTEALGAALDRMMGPVKRAGIRSLRLHDGADGLWG